MKSHGLESWDEIATYVPNVQISPLPIQAVAAIWNLSVALTRRYYQIYRKFPTVDEAHRQTMPAQSLLAEAWVTGRAGRDPAA